MGCGSSSSSKSNNNSPAGHGTAPGSEVHRSGHHKMQDAVKAGEDARSRQDEILLPADNDSPPQGRRSHLSSRASAVPDAADHDDASDAAADEAEIRDDDEEKLDTPVSQHQQQQPLPAPLKAAEEVSSMGQSAEVEDAEAVDAAATASSEAEAQAPYEAWQERLLGELNRQRMQVFSAELARVDLRRELCAIAQRLATRLADQRATVVSPTVDEAEQKRVKAGADCHLMPRVLTREESLDLNLYLAGLMAGMKAKEEDLVDRELLEGSDAALWTLNGSFGCARATFEIVESTMETEETQAVSSTEDCRQDFVVLVLAFCPQDRLESLAAAADNAEEDSEAAAATSKTPTVNSTTEEPEKDVEVVRPAAESQQLEPQLEPNLEQDLEHYTTPEVEALQQAGEEASC